MQFLLAILVAREALLKALPIFLIQEDKLKHYKTNELNLKHKS